MGKIKIKKCSCGSQTTHLINQNTDTHEIGCIKYQGKESHSEVIGKSWAPKLRDLFCECGGLYLSTTTDAVIEGSGSILFKQFACPSCSNEWSFLSMPSKELSTYKVSEDMAELISAYEKVKSLLSNSSEELVEAIHVLRNYCTRPRYTVIGRLKSIFGIFPENRIPPSDMPENKIFLKWVFENKLMLLGENEI